MSRFNRGQAAESRKSTETNTPKRIIFSEILSQPGSRFVATALSTLSFALVSGSTATASEVGTQTTPSGDVVVINTEDPFAGMDPESPTVPNTETAPVSYPAASTNKVEVRCPQEPTQFVQCYYDKFAANQPSLISGGEFPITSNAFMGSVASMVQYSPEGNLVSRVTTTPSNESIKVQVQLPDDEKYAGFISENDKVTLPNGSVVSKSVYLPLDRDAVMKRTVNARVVTVRSMSDWTKRSKWHYGKKVQFENWSETDINGNLPAKNIELDYESPLQKSIDVTLPLSADEAKKIKRKLVGVAINASVVPLSGGIAQQFGDFRYTRNFVALPGAKKMSVDPSIITSNGKWAYFSSSSYRVIKFNGQAKPTIDKGRASAYSSALQTKPTKKKQR